MSKPNIACKHGWSVSQRSAQCPHCGKERRESSESVSNIQSVDEILDKNLTVVGLAQDWDDDNEPDLWQMGRGQRQKLVAALERHEERIKVEAQINILKDITTNDNVFTYRRHGTDGSVLGIQVALRQLNQLTQQLKTLDGQENTNGK